MADTFYDNTPFEYGYSSKEEILENMNPNLKEIIIENKDIFVGEYTKQIDLSEYPQGIYIVQIKTNDSFVSKRVVIQ